VVVARKKRSTFCSPCCAIFFFLALLALVGLTVLVLHFTLWSDTAAKTAATVNPGKPADNPDPGARIPQNPTKPHPPQVKPKEKSYWQSCVGWITGHKGIVGSVIGLCCLGGFTYWWKFWDDDSVFKECPVQPQRSCGQATAIYTDVPGTKTGQCLTGWSKSKCPIKYKECPAFTKKSPCDDATPKFAPAHGTKDGKCQVGWTCATCPAFDVKPSCPNAKRVMTPNSRTLEGECQTDWKCPVEPPVGNANILPVLGSVSDERLKPNLEGLGTCTVGNDSVVTCDGRAGTNVGERTVRHTNETMTYHKIDAKDGHTWLCEAQTDADGRMNPILRCGVAGDTDKYQQPNDWRTNRLQYDYGKEATFFDVPGFGQRKIPSPGFINDAGKERLKATKGCDRELIDLTQGKGRDNTGWPRCPTKKSV